MSALLNARFTTETGGQLKYTRQINETIDNTGLTIDLSEIQFENVKGVTRFVKIVNYGNQPCYVAFDNGSDHFAIDADDRETWNLLIDSETPFNDVELHGETSKISLRCGEGAETNITIILW